VVLLEGSVNLLYIHVLSRVCSSNCSRYPSIVGLIACGANDSRVQSETIEGGLRGNQLLLDTAAKMWSHGGIRAYYRGLTLGLLGIVPYSAIDLGCFEGMKTTFKARMKSQGCSEDDAEPGILPQCKA